MKKNAVIFFLSLCVLLVLSGCAGRETPSQPPEAPAVEPAALDAPAAPQEADEPEPAPVLSPREQGWIDDINYLREQYKELHKDPFYWCSEEEFDWALDQVCEKVGELSDNDIYFELAEVIAKIGDNHTTLIPPASLYQEFFPIGLAYAGDKLYLFGYKEGYEQFAPYQLHEVVAVNGVDITYIQRKAENITNPYNTWSSKMHFTSGFFVPPFFDWVGCDYREGYTIQVLNDNREVVSLDLPLLSLDEMEAREWVDPERAKTLTGGNWAEYIQDESGGCIFVSFRDMTILDPDTGSTDIKYYLAFADEVNEIITAHPTCRKLAVDLRNNHGGYEIAASWLHRTKTSEIVQTYVLTDGRTASAAMSCVGILKANLNAVTVGEPTGQFPAFFSYRDNSIPQIKLPTSGITARCTNSWHQGMSSIVEVQYDEIGKLYPWESTVLPDVYVPQTIEDLRQGKDSVMEWVLAQ